MYHLTLSWGQSGKNKELVKINSVKASDKRFPVEVNRGRKYKLAVVTSVNKGKRQDTFDVETEQHWFWAGGFMSHNTVSSLVNSASGIHARHSQYYIRTVRSDKKDPLGKLMKDAGVPCEDDVMKPDATWVFSFPIKAPEGAVTRNERSAIEQLELWKTYQLVYTEHKPSITVSVREHEWLAVGAWCYENFDILSGVSFLPMSDHVYKQAPYQECTKEEYEAAVAAFPVIPWDRLGEYEKEDSTTSSQELACTGGACDIL
jgi:ribonucleoside-triphosphate reductase